MPSAKGYNSFLGIGLQTVLGTTVARTVFSRFNSESMQETNNVIDSARLAPSAQVAEQGLRFSSGTVVLDGNYTGQEIIFKHAMGDDTVTTPGGATLARLHTFTLLPDVPSPGLTVEIFKGGPSTDSHIYADCKIRRLRFGIRPNSFLQLEVDFIGRAETIDAKTASPSYPSLFPIACSQLVLQIDATPVAINSLDITLDNMLSGEDRPIAAGRDIQEPERTGIRLVEGSVEMDYTSATDYNKFKNFTDAAIIATFTGALIESGQNYGLTITLPRIKFRGSTPNAQNPGVLPLVLPFRAYESALGASDEIGITNKNINPTEP